MFTLFSCTFTWCPGKTPTCYGEDKFCHVATHFRKTTGARWLHCIWWHTISCSTRWSIGNSCNCQPTAQVRMIKKICQIQKSWLYLMQTPQQRLPKAKWNMFPLDELHKTKPGCHINMFAHSWQIGGWPAQEFHLVIVVFPISFPLFDSWVPDISRIRFWKEAINSYKPWRHGSYRISPGWKEHDGMLAK